MAMKQYFSEITVVCDDQKKIWQAISQALDQCKLEHLRLPSSTLLRQSWSRLSDSPYFIIHWECHRRSGGSLVEEILEIDPHYDVAGRIIIVTNEPSREDVIYFSELGLRKIVRLEANALQIGNAVKELCRFLSGSGGQSFHEGDWKRLQEKTDKLASPPGSGEVEAISEMLSIISDSKSRATARYCDIVACLAFKEGNTQLADQFWHKALDFNPHYVRAYRGLIELYCQQKEFRRALDMIQNLQRQNKNNISRIVKMGEIYSMMADDTKAEHYFQLALERDKHCGSALNGLASIRFRSGQLEEARKLLERSSKAYKMAKTLNEEGIALVRQEEYEAALQHYFKAQYVLPQHNKGPMLFYNIGLCYSRWGKIDLAQDFLKLALTKEPDYEKAQKLLEQLSRKSTSDLAS